MPDRPARPRASRLARAASMAAFVLLAGCSQGSDLALLPPYDPGVYRLGVADQLRIVTYGDEQLTREFHVNEDGKVAMPLLGDVDAAGMTTGQLASAIAEALKAKQLLRNPSVSVEVISFRPVFVLGEVVKPGPQPYQPGMTMLTAVAGASGFTYRGVQDYAYVVRQNGKSTITGKLRPQDYVQPGDVLKIYERYF